MITEDYCSFEVAKLLKEKGFDESCWQKYDNEGYLSPNHVGYINNEKPCDDFCALAPTHQMAMKWLRENGIDISIMPINPNEYNPTKRYMWETGSYMHKRGVENAYEEAVEAALKYCLANLKN